VSKADYPYPEDEFDAISPDAPTGVHRAPRSTWSRWWPFLVVLLVVPVLAWGVVTYLSRTGSLPGDAAPPAGGSSGEVQEPPAGDGTTDEPADGADGGTGEEQPPPEETTEAPQPVLTTSVRVLNGARVSGLAAEVAGQLTSAGFTTVTPDNATGSLPAQSTVFIASEDLRATADLVASTVGVPTVVVDAARAGSAISVVLVTDPRG
jgi:hypothetical protein